MANFPSTFIINNVRERIYFSLSGRFVYRQTLCILKVVNLFCHRASTRGKINANRLYGQSPSIWVGGGIPVAMANDPGRTLNALPGNNLPQMKNV